MDEKRQEEPLELHFTLGEIKQVVEIPTQLSGRPVFRAPAMSDPLWYRRVLPGRTKWIKAEGPSVTHWFLWEMNVLFLYLWIRKMSVICFLSVRRAGLLLDRLRTDTGWHPRAEKSLNYILVNTNILVCFSSGRRRHWDCRWFFLRLPQALLVKDGLEGRRNLWNNN